MEVLIDDQQEDLRISKSQVEELVKECLKHENVECNEVSIQFVDQKTISRLHMQFFNDPSVTDCISFPIDSDENNQGYRVLGEVIVCPKTGIDYSNQHHLNPYQEVSLYVVHGLLHLAGYDDAGEAEEAMRKAEERHLRNLMKKNLLLKETPCTF